MHAAIQGPKIAHLAAQSVARALAHIMGTTPARFDMLRAIGTDRTHWRRQDDLCRMLGVSSSNVARMLKALRALGLVERVRHTDDGRTWNLRLTKAGAALLEKMGPVIMGWAHRFMAEVVCGRGDWVMRMMHLEDQLHYYAYRFFGRSIPPLYAYGHPDD